MQINEILLAKFPNAFKEWPFKIILQDDGDGVYIKEWNIEEPKPTETQLNAWATELEDALFNDKQRELRKTAYGTWQEQMDMQFHGTWEGHIASIKELFPLREIL